MWPKLVLVIAQTNTSRLTALVYSHLSAYLHPHKCDAVSRLQLSHCSAAHWSDPSWVHMLSIGWSARQRVSAAQVVPHQDARGKTAKRLPGDSRHRFIVSALRCLLFPSWWQMLWCLLRPKVQMALLVRQSCFIYCGAVQIQVLLLFDPKSG